MSHTVDTNDLTPRDRLTDHLPTRQVPETHDTPTARLTAALTRRGPRSVAVFVDGSLDAEHARAALAALAAVEAYAATIGARLERYQFDGATVAPYDLTRPIRGGGGTRLDDVYDVAEGRTAAPAGDERCDVNVVITDGFVPKAYPTDLNAWIFAIPADGDPWTRGETKLVFVPAQRSRFLGLVKVPAHLADEQTPAMETVIL